MNVYLLAGARTPFGSFMGQLANVPAPKLAAHAIKGAIERSGVSQGEINEVIMGNVVSAGVGQNPARQAMLFAGLPNSIPATTVSKVCGSGLRSIIMAAQTIKAQDNQLVVAGGMENMSIAPHLIPQMRNGVKFGTTEIKDAVQFDGLWDMYNNVAMGNLVEMSCVKEYNFTREMQDEYAIESYKRALQAQKDGIFRSEIVPYTISVKGADVTISEDESPAQTKFDKIPKLKPAFIPNGTVTAANASSLNDAGAAIILGGENYKNKAKFRIVSYAGAAQDPVWFSTAPVNAMKLNLEKSNMKISDIDLFEVNEAFSCVAMAAQKAFNIPRDRLNIYGGAVSLGHPIGVSGTRIILTLMNGLERNNLKRGMASICIGGGEALSIIIERI